MGNADWIGGHEERIPDGSASPEQLTKEWQEVAVTGRTEFYALLPYEVRGLDLTCSELPGGIHIMAKVQTDDAAVHATTHVFRIQVFEPSGRERRELARNVLAEQGRTKQDLFVGYNASPGQWRIRVQDVATGTVREQAFSR